MTYDYLGVWAPAPDPLPLIDPVTFAPLATMDVRLIDADGHPVPDDPPKPLGDFDATSPLIQWALSVTPDRSYREKQVAATVLHTGAHPEAEEFLQKSGIGAWAGAVSTRYKGRAVVGTVTRMADGDFGPVYKVLLTIDGYECVWFTGENVWCDDGDECDVRYTVKAHVVFEGRKQTLVKNVQKAK